MNGPMLHIIYSPENGSPIPDGKCEEYLEKSYNRVKGTKQELACTVSTSNVIDCVRAMIAKKQIKAEHVAIYFGEQKIEMDRLLQLQEWPKGFCDHSMVWMSELFRFRGDLLAKEKVSGINA